MPLRRHSRLKREARTEQFKKAKEDKKAKRAKRVQEEREGQDAAGTGVGAAAAPAAAGTGKAARKREELRKRWLGALESSPTVIFDMDFEEQCTDSEKKSCVQQLMYCYGANRKADRPLQLAFNSVRGGTKAGLEKIMGFANWLGVTSDARSYLEAFDKSQIVYLSADAPTVLETLDADKCYVIGGIVDHNRLKGATYDKALEQGVATARLPISEYCTQGKSSGSRSVLTVNHVFSILLHYNESQDWRTAFRLGIPARKGFRVQAVEGEGAGAVGGGDEGEIRAGGEGGSSITHGMVDEEEGCDGSGNRQASSSNVASSSSSSSSSSSASSASSSSGSGTVAAEPVRGGGNGYIEEVD